MMYVVTKQGVYLQDVHGPYHSCEYAKERAQALGIADYDDYHEWEVRPLTQYGLGDVLASYRKNGYKQRALREALQEKGKAKAAAS